MKKTAKMEWKDEECILVKYNGGTVEGSLTEGRVYKAFYFTRVGSDGTRKRYDDFFVRDDTGYITFYDNDEFEIIWKPEDGMEKPCEGYFPPQGRW